MANTGAGIDIIIAESCTYEFLYQVGFLITTARGCNATNTIPAVFGLNLSQTSGGKLNRFFPTDFTPGLVNTVADHRPGDAVFVAGITKGKTALDTGMAFVGLTVLVRCHAHHLVIPRFIDTGLNVKRTAHTTISAGRDRTFVRQAQFDN